VAPTIPGCHAGDREEPGQTDVPSAAEDRPAQPGGQGDASHAGGDIAPRASVRGLTHQTPEEQNGFRSLTEDSGEGDQAHEPQATSGQRGLKSALDIALDLSGVLAHPPPVPCQERRGAEGHGLRGQTARRFRCDSAR
jgi:hypothetical protein